MLWDTLVCGHHLPGHVASGIYDAVSYETNMNNTWGRDVIQGSWWGNVKERDHSEDLGTDGRKY
jgi:hypothetical protein